MQLPQDINTPLIIFDHLEGLEMYYYDVNVCKTKLDYHYGKIYFKFLWAVNIQRVLEAMIYAILDFQLIWLLSIFDMKKKNVSLHVGVVGTKIEVNNTWIIAIWSNLAAILAAILDLQSFDYLVTFVLIKCCSLTP